MANKYHAKRWNGYDSKHEAARAAELRRKERAGEITNLREQVLRTPTATARAKTSTSRHFPEFPSSLLGRRTHCTTKSTRAQQNIPARDGNKGGGFGRPFVFRKVSFG